MPSFQSCGPAPTAAAVLRWHKTLCVQSLLRLAAIAAGRGDAALTSVRCDYDDSRAVPLALALALLPLPARARPGLCLAAPRPRCRRGPRTYLLGRSSTASHGPPG